MNTLLETWRQISLLAGDTLFGPLLAWSRDAALLAVVIASVAVLVLLRRIGTNQSVLRSVTLDLRTLRRLMRNTPRADIEARRRYRATRARVARMHLAEQLPTVLLSVMLVGSMISWGWQRLQYLPPKAGEVINFVAYTPVSRVGTFAHLVPQENLDMNATRVRSISMITRNGASPRARANWMFTISEPGRYEIVVRSDTKTMRHVAIIGEKYYARPLQRHGSDWETELRMNEYYPFGFVSPMLGISGWLVAYLVLVLGLFLLLRWMLGIW